MNSSFSDLDFTIEPETPSPDGSIGASDVDWDEDADGVMPADSADDFSLGFDFAAAEAPDRSGLGALVNSTLVAHQKMPVLDLILDRAARRMSTSLRHLTEETTEVALDDVTTIRFGDFVHGADGPIVVGVLRSAPLGGYALIVAEMDLVLTTVDLLLGGRRGSMAWTEEGRAFTAIELSLAQRMLETIIGDIEAAFAPVIEPKFILERIETTPRFAAIVQEASACIMAKFRVRMGAHRARASLILPKATLDRVRSLLTRDFIGECGAGDDHWRAALGEGLDHGSVSLAAVLGERMMTIGEISGMRPGDRLDFHASPLRLARLVVGACDVGVGRVGRVGDRLAIRIGAQAAPEALTLRSRAMETGQETADAHGSTGETS